MSASLALTRLMIAPVACRGMIQRPTAKAACLILIPSMAAIVAYVAVQVQPAKIVLTDSRHRLATSVYRDFWGENAATLVPWPTTNLQSANRA